MNHDARCPIDFKLIFHDNLSDSYEMSQVMLATADFDGTLQLLTFMWSDRRCRGGNPRYDERAARRCPEEIADNPTAIARPTKSAARRYVTASVPTPLVVAL